MGDDDINIETEAGEIGGEHGCSNHPADPENSTTRAEEGKGLGSVSRQIVMDKSDMSNNKQKGKM